MSERIGIQVRTLQRWRLESQGPPFRKLCGGAVRYSEQDLENWLRAQPMGGDRAAMQQPGAGA